MAITKRDGRQEVKFAYVDINLADLTTAVAAGAIDLPQNAEVVGGYAVVKEVFNSTTSDVLDIGDSGSANRYKNDVNLQALGLTALVPTGYVYTAPTTVTVTWVSGGGSPSTGEVRLGLQYVVHGRSTSTQTNA